MATAADVNNHKIAGLIPWKKKSNPPITAPAALQIPHKRSYKCRYCLRRLCRIRGFCDALCRQMAEEDCRSYALALGWKLNQGKNAND